MSQGLFLFGRLKSLSVTGFYSTCCQHDWGVGDGYSIPVLLPDVCTRFPEIKIRSPTTAECPAS